MPAPRIVLIPVGSGGDVYPFVGIGRALQQRGHDVTVVSAEPFRSMVENAGIDFVPHQTEEEFERIVDNPDLFHPRKGVHLLMQSISERLRTAYDMLSDLCDPDNTVLVSHGLAFSARVYEEKHKLRAAVLHLAPSVFRSTIAPPALAPGKDRPLPAPLMRMIFWLVDRFMIDPNILPELNQLRVDVGLAPVARIFKEWIHSPQCTIALFPKWFRPPPPDWPKDIRLTGFPLFDQSDQEPLSSPLEDFLRDGDPPVLFTPGTAHRHAADFFAAAVDAASHMNRRALLLTKYREQLPTTLPDHVRHESYVPFSLLLPRCAAIVHHGGIGTCAQGLAAGIPQLTMPMGFDQPDNTTRLYRLGVGSWVTPNKFTGPRVAETITRLLGDRQVAESCERWRKEMAKGDPVGETCEIIERLAGGLPQIIPKSP